MREKHPQSQVPLLHPDPESSPLRLQASQILKAVTSFKRGSALGLSGLRADHLKVAVKAGPRADRAVDSITKFSNLLLAGGLPPEVALFFCGARLHAARKKGGVTVR